MKHHIFDLDGTVICSKHRQRLKTNGDLDLAHWIAHRADRDLVFRDRLLPLSRFWFALQAYEEAPAICTSRVVSELEYEYLEKNGLRFSTFMHRTEGDMRGDAEYKVSKIRDHLEATGWEASVTTLYEDHAGVREAVKRELGLKVLNPIPLNGEGYSPSLTGATRWVA